jgi:hypothetical protein
MDTSLLILGDSVDHLIALDIQWPGRPRGMVDSIHQACRRHVGGPVCLSAASGLLKRVTKDSTVIISTGFVLPPFFPLGETDGPPGAVALARAIVGGIGARVMFLTEPETVGALQGACIAAGLSVYEEKDFGAIPGAALIREFPREVDEAIRESNRILDSWKPAAVITVEKMGRNVKNIYHSARGSDMSPRVAKVDYLVEAAQQRNVLTIGIGDLGNEIGMGTVADVVRKAIGPEIEQCKCGCGEGIVTKVGADFPIMTTTSNWGCYGIAACMAAILEKPSILHTPELERRVLEACVWAGARDGVMVTPSPSSDGVSLEGNQAVIQLLIEIARVKTIKSTPYRA